MACLYALRKSIYPFCCGNQPNIFTGPLNSSDWLGYYADGIGNFIPELPFVGFFCVFRFFNAEKEIVHAHNQTLEIKGCQIPKTNEVTPISILEVLGQVPAS